MSQISAGFTNTSVGGAHSNQVASPAESQIAELHVIRCESTVVDKETEPQDNKLLLQVIILNCLYFVSYCSQLF